MEKIEARISLELGNFLTAQKQFMQLAKKSKTLVDKIFYNKTAQHCAEQYKNSLHIVAGEAFFPVRDKKNNENRLLKVKCEKSLSSVEHPKWLSSLIETMSNYFDEMLRKREEKIFVFDWGLKSLAIKFTDLQEKEITLQELEGKSYELAAAAAIFSFFFQKKISANYIFTGGVNKNFHISSVSLIEEKYEVCMRERKANVKLFIPADNGNRKKEINKIDNLDSLFEVVFGATVLGSIENITNNNDIRSIKLEVKNVRTSDKKYHRTAIFTTPEKLSIKETTIVMADFLPRITSYLSDPKGMIIDGLRQSHLYFRLGMMMKENHISNFIAVRSFKKEDTNTGKSSATVVITTNKGESQRSVGEEFEYYLP